MIQISYKHIWITLSVLFCISLYLSSHNMVYLFLAGIWVAIFVLLDMTDNAYLESYHNYNTQYEHNNNNITCTIPTKNDDNPLGQNRMRIWKTMIPTYLYNAEKRDSYLKYLYGNPHRYNKYK